MDGDELLRSLVAYQKRKELENAERESSADDESSDDDSPPSLASIEDEPTPSLCPSGESEGYEKLKELEEESSYDESRDDEESSDDETSDEMPGIGDSSGDEESSSDDSAKLEVDMRAMKRIITGRSDEQSDEESEEERSVLAIAVRAAKRKILRNAMVIAGGGVKTTPIKKFFEQQRAERTPQEAERTPEKAEATPQKAEATPQKAKATPQKAEEEEEEDSEEEKEEFTPSKYKKQDFKRWGSKGGRPGGVRKQTKAETKRRRGLPDKERYEPTAGERLEIVEELRKRSEDYGKSTEERIRYWRDMVERHKGP